MIIGKAISPFAIKRRNGGGGGNDADAQAFITASGISGTEATATNQLVIDLKAANIWTKIKAAYPMVGGTATSCKWNLKDARDLDAAYRLVFSGGVTFSSNGVFGNGTNAFADTFLIPSTNFVSPYNMHLSANIITDWANTGVVQNHIGISAPTTTGNYRLAATNATGERSYMARILSTDEILITVTSTTHKGFWCASRTANNVNNFIQPNGTITLNSNLVTTATLSNLYSIKLIAQGGSFNSLYSAFGYSFFSIGDGLTTTEMTAFKTAVNNFNTTLGRL
jgi:hypothetical protein